MKSLLWLLRQVLEDIQEQSAVDLQKDFDYIEARVEHEGLSFLTITLPSFCDALERGLSLGQWPTDLVTAFKKAGSKSSLPALLQGLTKLVFHMKDGVLKEQPDVNAIFYIRVLTRMFKKLEIDCSEDRTAKAFRDFHECDSQVGYGLDTGSVDLFGRTADILWARLHGSFDPDAIVPKHGPGATQEKITGNRKFLLRTWYTRLERQVHSDSCVIPNWNFAEALAAVDFKEPRDELPVRVVSVPKTLKSPRIIAIEPVHMQYVQQGYLEFLTKELETRGLTAGHVNFTDQSINQRFAKMGSVDGSIATLDLSEASDRVSAKLAWRMLRTCPTLRAGLFASRSSKAITPDGRIRVLRKFASMGSAVCFPVESMYFFTAVISAMHYNDGKRPSVRSVERYAKQVYVYGDDLIVPVDYAACVCEWFQTIGLKVNTNKSFWTGKFRESCGGDYYDGVDVKPIYYRRLLEADRPSAKAIVSNVSFINQLYQAGLWKSSFSLRKQLERSIRKTLPYTSKDNGGLAWHHIRFSSVKRWNKQLHRFEVRAVTPSPRKQKDPLDGFPALMKSFLMRKSNDPYLDIILGRSSTSDETHLEQSAVPRAIRLKHAWVAVQSR